MAGPDGSCPVGGPCQYGCPGAECYRENTRFADTPFAAVTLEAPTGERGVLIGPAGKIAVVVRPAAVVAACRVCGCTEDHACPNGCWWVSDPERLGHLCSACLPVVSA